MHGITQSTALHNTSTNSLIKKGKNMTQYSLKSQKKLNDKSKSISDPILLQSFLARKAEGF